MRILKFAKRGLFFRNLHTNTQKPSLKTIGIVAVTAPGTALCYETIVKRSIELFGGHHHPSICMHHHNFELYHNAQLRGEWERVANLLLESTKSVHKAGAEFAVIPANTVHRKEILTFLNQNSPIPILSILDVVADCCKKNSYARAIILGTKWTMRDNIYKDVLMNHSIESIIPVEEEQKIIQNVIVEELIPGKWTSQTVSDLLNIVSNIKNRNSLINTALILGCTELPLVLNDRNCKMPVIDSTRELAIAAVNLSVNNLNLHLEKRSR